MELKEKTTLLITVFVNIKQEVDGELELRGTNKKKTCPFVIATCLSTLSALPSSPDKEL